MPKMKENVTSGGFARRIRISISQEQLANNISDPWVDPSKRDEKVLCLHPAQGQSRSSPGREVFVAIGNGCSNNATIMRPLLPNALHGWQVHKPHSLQISIVWHTRAMAVTHSTGLICEYIF